MSNSFDDAAASMAATIERNVDAPVTLGWPKASGADAAVDLQLLGIRHGAEQHHRGLHRLPVDLEFMISVTGPGDVVAGLLHDVIVAIDASPDHELSRDVVPVDWWLAFGVLPRPAIRVHTSVEIDRTIDEAPLVTELLLIEPQLHRPLSGAVAERRA